MSLLIEHTKYLVVSMSVPVGGEWEDVEVGEISLCV